MEILKNCITFIAIVMLAVLAILLIEATGFWLLDNLFRVYQ